MKVIILGGFLGAGKTSVLLQLAKHVVAQDPGNPNRIAIIENEIGDIGVDDQTLGGSGGYQVQSLFSGCVCCTLAVELVAGLQQMRDEINPDFAVIEPSGVADPGDLKKKILDYVKGVEVSVIEIVDAQRWPRVVRAMGQLLPNQIGAANLILVNKVDKVAEIDVAAIDEQLRGYNETAPIRHISANAQLGTGVLDMIAGA